MSFSLSTSTSLLRSRIEASDIQFNRVDLDNVNKYSIGYNLGDLIGMPALYLNSFAFKEWSKIYHVQREGMTTDEIREFVISLHPVSILKFYFHPVIEEEEDERTPNSNSHPDPDRLRSAITQYWRARVAEGYPLCEDLESIRSIVSSDNVLCAHLRCGDTTIDTDYDPDYTESLARLAERFERVIIFTGLIPGYASTLGYENVRMAAFNHINRLLDRIPNAQVLIDGTVDDHLYVFKDAKHLALHRGGISQALSILNKNNIYINQTEGWWKGKTTRAWRAKVEGRVLPMTSTTEK